MDERRSMMHATALARLILPRAVVTHLRVARTVPLRNWLLYWRIWSQRTLRPNGRVKPGVTRSILFVCRGNVIRSPLAAAMLRHDLSTSASTSTIASAGLHVSAEQPADPRARRIAREFGISLEDHQSRPMTGELVAQADVIVPMDALVATELLVRHPGARSKTVLLDDIADPYDDDDAGFRRCCERIRAAIRSFAPTIAMETAAASVVESPRRRGDPHIQGGIGQSCE